MSTMLGGPREDLFGIVLDFANKLNNGTILPSQAKRFLRKEDPWVNPMDTHSQLERACALYRQAFGIIINPLFVEIPKCQVGRSRLIVVPQGLTMNHVIVFFRTQFTVSLYADDLDRAVTKNDRTNGKTYAIWVQDVVEADEELKGLSANDLAEKKIPGITLLERLLHEVLYFSETNKHLDIENSTLCAGSRRSDGFVPAVGWNEDDHELCVGWGYPGDRSENGRTRAVVSLSDAA